MKKLVWMGLIAGALNVFGAGVDGGSGLVCQIDHERHSFTLLGATAYDPKKDEGERRFKMYWDGQTVFRHVRKLTDLSTLKPGDIARLNFSAKNIRAFEAGTDFRVDGFMLMPQLRQAEPRRPGARVFYCEVKPVAGHADVFETVVAGKTLRGTVGSTPITRLDTVRADELKDNRSIVTVRGAMRGKDFYAAVVTVTEQLPDPRETDDPKLPRALVVGDSISMNYHEDARKALLGKVNYHRIYNNAGRSQRGVDSLDLWLGDTTPPNRPWDVVAVNHGLHDLLVLAKGEQWGSESVIRIAEYRKNLDKIFHNLTARPGVKVIWLTTTPVPNDGFLPGYGGRRKDAELAYNAAALEVLKKYPSVQVCDLNRLVRGSRTFDAWRRGNNVHFKGAECAELGNAVAAAILKALEK